MSITEERLTDIQARLAAATDGPWRSREFDPTPGDWGCAILAQTGNAMTEHLIAYTMTYGNEVQTEADAELITNAPTDLTDLLAEVHRLREELAKSREVTEDKVERVLRAVKPYVFDRLADMDAEDMAWDATRAALGGGDNA